jgi:flagellin
MKLLNGERSNTREVTGMNFVGGTDTTSNAGGTGFDVKLLGGSTALSAGSHELDITVDRNTRAVQTENTSWSDFTGASTGTAAGVVFDGNTIEGTAATGAETWTLTYSDATTHSDDGHFVLTNLTGDVTDVVLIGEEYSNHDLTFKITDKGTIANGETLVFETTENADSIGTQQVGWTANASTTEPANVTVTITDAQEASFAGGGKVTATWKGSNDIEIIITDSDGNELAKDTVDGSASYDNHGISINFAQAATADHVGAKFEFDIADDTYTVNASLDSGSAVEIMNDYDGTSATVADFAGVSGLELSVDGAITARSFEFDVEQTVEGDDNSLNFQIGANQAQSMNLSIADMRAVALGISSASSGGDFASDKAVTDGTDASGAEYALDVSSHTTAAKAVTVINDAIERVSAERSMLGASQNRLEHTIANLGTSSENLQAAESRIRDLDMAQEIMAFTKNNILQQAATAMLAQANMAPQSVLQLLG